MVEMIRRVVAVRIPTIEITLVPSLRKRALLNAVGTLGTVTEQSPLQHEAIVRLATDHDMPLSDAAAAMRMDIEARGNIAAVLGRSVQNAAPGRPSVAS